MVIIMEKGQIHVFYGSGSGKSSAAFGKAVQVASQGRNVVIIQFLKGSGYTDAELLSRLEPELKIFRFEKSTADFAELTEEKQAEEVMNIRNGLNFAKKVLTTGECKLLVLDEVLGLIDNCIISEDELQTLLELRSDETDIIMTGITVNQNICMMADAVSKIEKFK